MGLWFLRRGHGGRSGESDIEQRFGAYFPRAFAYAFSNLGDEAATREVLGDGFSRAFTEASHSEEESFRIALFKSIHQLCRERRRKMPLDIGLGGPERDVVTLTFDAGLASSEVDEVLGTDTAAVHLASALSRMRQTSSPSIIPSFYRLT